MAGRSGYITVAFFISVWIKFFFLLTPFFALSMFLHYTAGMAARSRAMAAAKVTVAVSAISVFLFFAGTGLFSVLGITVDSFRVGAGALLFLSAVSLVRGGPAGPEATDEFAVVPLAVPVIVGPATTGAILIMGAEISPSASKFTGLAALLFAILCVGAMLLCSSLIERAIRRRGLTILSKLTGLVLAALAAQMVFTGAGNLLRPR
jgi:multiple antibiotic resistance protein